MSRKKLNRSKSRYPEIGRRFEIAFRTRGSPSKIADKLTVDTSTVYAWMNGEQLPEGKYLKMIKEILDISLDWLMAGKKSIEVVQAQITADEIGKSYHAIPLLRDPVAGGNPLEIREEDIDSYALIFRDPNWVISPENYTCVRMRGDSMEPILVDGCIVAIDHRRPSSLEELQGKIIAFRKNGGVTIKRLRIIDQNLIIGIPDNENSTDSIRFTEEEINTAIIGKVAWWWGRQK